MKIGIDLGGTNMRVALADGGKIIRRNICPCPSKASKSEVLEQLESMIASCMSSEVKGIGAGVPSVVDVEKGIVYNVANIPSWDEVPLGEILEEQFKVPARINNDANCFALGEKLFGNGAGVQNMVGITMGTGVGAGIIIDGHLYNGRNAGAGEIGTLPFRDSDYEHYCASDYFVRFHGTTGKDAAQRARSGDSSAKAIWNEFGHNVGELMKAVLFIYDPEMIVIGGGISSSFDLFKDAMWETMRSFPYQKTIENISIKASSDEDSALLGASALVDQ